MTDWTAAELTIAKLLVQDGKDAQQISDELAQAGFRRTHQAVRRLLQRKRATEAGWHALVAQNPACAPRWDKPLSVKADRVLLMADVHAPFHDADWCNRLIDLALGYGVDTVGVMGDLVDFDAFSKWGRQERVEAEPEDPPETPAWAAGVKYAVGDRVVYNGTEYVCRQGHTSISTWTPPVVPAVWAVA